MVHAEVDVGGVRAAAQLYAELSNRVDPSSLSFEVLRGGDPSSSILWRIGSGKGQVFAGFHAGCSKVPHSMEGPVQSPLFLLPEERIVEEYDGLSLKASPAHLDWRGLRAVKPMVERFGGVRADLNGVLDGLR
jgi:hypothetical protein